MKLNIRNKLIIFAVLAIVLPILVSALVIIVQLSSYADQRSTERIKSDARVAKSIFDKRQENIRAAAQSIAQTLAARGIGRSAAPAAGAPTGSGAQPAAAPAPVKATSDVLKAQLETNKLSFVVLLNPQGKVIAQHSGGPSGDGNQFADNGLFKGVTNRTQQGSPEAQSGVAVESQAVIDATNLKDRATVKGVTDGLFLEAAAPVLSGDSLQSVVLVGQLVNNDNEVTSDKQQSIVNEIKETVYRDLREDAGVIIANRENIILSTNLTGSQSGGVAIGEKVDAGAGDFANPSLTGATFGSGIAYYTSFVPIESVDPQGGASKVGHIGVAIKQDWFTAIVRKVWLTIVIVSLLALVLAVAGAVVAAQRLTRPIVELTEAANRISLGELDVPISVSSDDEIGTLGESLDRMRISLKQAIERLRKR